MDVAIIAPGTATLAGELGVISGFGGDLGEEAGCRRRQAELVQASLLPTWL